MPGTRITLDLQGRPVVPNDPIVVAIEGDGPGPMLVRIAREAIDRAVSGAYGTARRIHWQPALAGERARREKGRATPDSTLAELRRARVALVGPVATQPGERHVVDEAGSLLDLWFEATWVRTPPLHADGPALDVAFFADAGADLAAGAEFVPGSAPVAPLLRALDTPVKRTDDHEERPLDRLPFGTAARADAYATAQDRLPTGLPPTGLTIRHQSRHGIERLAPELARWSRRLLKPTLVVCDEQPLHPATDGAARRWLEPALASIDGVNLAPEPTDAPLHVRFATFPALLRTLLSDTPPPAVAANAVTARRLRRLLASRGAHDRHVPQARLDPAAAAGLFTVPEREPATGDDAVSPLPWVLAGAMLLDHLGWVDAALDLRVACDALADARRFPTRLADDLGLTDVERLGALAWSRALFEQLS